MSETINICETNVSSYSQTYGVWQSPPFKGDLILWGIEDAYNADFADSGKVNILCLNIHTMPEFAKLTLFKFGLVAKLPFFSNFTANLEHV